jgi:hypothetical protein
MRRAATTATSTAGPVALRRRGRYQDRRDENKCRYGT